MTLNHPTGKIIAARACDHREDQTSHDFSLEACSIDSP